MNSEYRFRIADSYTPATLPMERLGEYIAALAKLLGETQNVHFRSVTDGSAVLVADVDHEAQPKVHDRVRAVRDGTGPSDALKAFAELDDLLRRDNATGALMNATGAVIIPFPGRTRPEPLVFGPFRQDGTIDGQLLRVGGKDDTVPVHLRDGPVTHVGLYTNPDIARRIAVYLLGPTLRVHGTGKWIRLGDGTWKLQEFEITNFEVLDDTSLTEVVANLRRVKGSRWSEVPDPLRDLLEGRHGEGGAN